MRGAEFAVLIGIRSRPTHRLVPSMHALIELITIHQCFRGFTFRRREKAHFLVVFRKFTTFSKEYLYHFLGVFVVFSETDPAEGLFSRGKRRFLSGLFAGGDHRVGSALHEFD
jgi:hypothetical protein